MQGVDLGSGDPGRTEVFAEGWAGSEYMVRTSDYKLLFCRDSGQSQFFDLQRDPLELDNRIRDPSYAQTISGLREALLRWGLFDSRTQTYLDPSAPIISGHNVPSRNDDHVQGMTTYFRSRMSPEDN
jgi:hypothetical protein